MSNDLHSPLSDLNLWLAEQDLEVELIIIGAFALHLHGYSNRMTMDIDTVKPIESVPILEKIKLIGEKYGLPQWLNDQADNLIMPEGFSSRLKYSPTYSHIKLYYIAREDLIKLKVAAYFYRGEEDPKDRDDLISLGVSVSELENAFDFMMERHLPDIKRFRLQFLERLRQIDGELRGLCV